LSFLVDERSSRYDAQALLRALVAHAVSIGVSTAVTITEAATWIVAAGAIAA
jgi:hypothetical protein